MLEVLEEEEEAVNSRKKKKSRDTLKQRKHSMNAMNVSFFLPHSRVKAEVQNVEHIPLGLTIQKNPQLYNP